MINQSIAIIHDIDIGNINAPSRDIIVVKRGYSMSTIMLYFNKKGSRFG